MCSYTKIIQKRHCKLKTDLPLWEKSFEIILKLLQ